MRLSKLLSCVFGLFLVASSSTAFAAEVQDFTRHWAGYLVLLMFGAAYALVVLEENIHLKKSKPMMLFAGIIWIVVAIAYRSTGAHGNVTEMLRHNLLEFSELMLFLMSAMVYINTLDERNVFGVLRGKLVSSRLSLRSIYWITGLLAFFISPFADNLTTALVMGAVALAIGGNRKGFIVVACINIVVAANAGGAFSPFGDITTLMVWQKGLVEFHEFFALFIPAIVSWLIPAFFMSFKAPRRRPAAIQRREEVKQGGFVIVALFFLTIAMTVILHHTLDLPPFIGMMTGLGFLKVYGYFITRREERSWHAVPPPKDAHYKVARKPFDVFISLKRVEWDTLLFFYGVMLCVGGLNAMGHLSALAEQVYQGLGATAANTLVGILSAIVDNIPIMFAVLSMNPDISHGQWLLVTLTAGIGGSLLSIGSAAGVALMGQARGVYTFSAHLRWTWAIGLGYAAGIIAHIVLNEVQ